MPSKICKAEHEMSLASTEREYGMGISAVLLAYKEEENLRVLLPQVIRQLELVGEPYEVLVIDSAEPQDNTECVCRELGCRYIPQEYPFFAGAFKTGIKYAQMEKFLIMDADCSHPPQVIPVINEKFELSGADLVIGSRYVEGGVSNDSKSSRVMSRILNGCFRKAMAVDARDLSTDFRMYRTRDLKEVELKCERYDVLEEVILQIKMRHGGDIHVEEVPIEFQKRAFGQSKRQLLVFILHYARTVISLFVQRKCYERNPSNLKEVTARASLLTNIVLYFCIGCCGAVVDYAAFCVAEAVCADAATSNVAGAFAGFVFCFYFNTFFNFISRGHYLAKFGCYALVCLIGTFVSTGMMVVGQEYLNVYIMKIFCIPVAAVIQFVLNYSVTYRIFGNEGPRNPNLR